MLKEISLADEIEIKRDKNLTQKTEFDADRFKIMWRW